MKDFFRQSMAWLHTWSGLVPGWMLYFIFLTGTLGYFDTEIDRWMKPELPQARYDLSSAPLATSAVEYLQREAAGAKRWFVSLPVDRNQPYLRVFWPGKDRGQNNKLLDPANGEPFAARDTGGGQLLYRMHWNLHYLPKTLAHWLVGAATLGMFVALITGIIIHVKIFKDFFTFRPAKGQRSWLDAHNVLSVSALPFHVMITFTGLLFMAGTYMPLIAAAQYGASAEGQKRFNQELFGNMRDMPAAGVAAPLTDLVNVVREGERLWGQGGVESFEVINPGDASARVLLHRRSEPTVSRSNETYIFDGVSGALLEQRPANTSGAKTARDFLLGLHEGLFAGPIVRGLYALSGLLGSAMIATGLVLWVVKRRQREHKKVGGEGFGLRLVERLNIGTLIGLPVGVAAFFWANRLLPVELLQRDEWETHALFLTWGAMLLHAALRPTAKAWTEQLGIAALTFGLLPMLNAFTTDRGLVPSVRSEDWVFAGFDIAMLAVGLVSAWGAYRTWRRQIAKAALPSPKKPALQGVQA